MARNEVAAPRWHVCDVAGDRLFDENGEIAVFSWRGRDDFKNAKLASKAPAMKQLLLDLLGAIEKGDSRLEQETARRAAELLADVGEF